MRILLENVTRKMNYFQNKFPCEYQELKVIHELYNCQRKKWKLKCKRTSINKRINAKTKNITVFPCEPCLVKLRNG